MQHIDSEHPANAHQCLLPHPTATRYIHKASPAFRTRLAKSLLLPALLLGGAVEHSFAQSTCALQLTTAATNVQCGTPGAINLSLNGGTGPYTYAWAGPNGFTATTEDLSGLAAGVYSVAVTDNATQCTATTTATVTTIADTTPPVLRAAGFEVTLINGTYTALADDVDYGSFDTCSGIASLSINPSTFTCANVGPNQVTFTATDNAGNSASTVVTVLIQADATCSPLANTTATAATQRLQVYPNPAASAATLAFVAEKTGAAQVLVYNSMGQQVATLYDGEMQAGKDYRFTLQSTTLANGVYTCQVRTAGRVYSTRLLLAK